MLKPTKILVPTDFTGYSDRALKQAISIAAAYDADVYVLHVVHERIHSMLSEDFSDVAMTEAAIKKLQKSIVVKAQVRLEKEVRKLSASKNVRIHQIVRNGLPYEEILKEQKALGANLIVVGSLGHGGIGRFLIGSVARNVLKGAECPVLLVKNALLSGPQRILVPTDFSPYSDRALKQGLDIARQYGASLFLFHALPFFQYAGFSEEVLMAVEKQSEERAAAAMERQLAAFPQARSVPVTAESAPGLTYEAILNEERAKKIDLIVIASLGQSGIAKYLLGSVARNVLKGAECPVLVTR
jgi:nucleotide-binding universal stress UspA family protein